MNKLQSVLTRRTLMYVCIALCLVGIVTLLLPIIVIKENFLWSEYKASISGSQLLFGSGNELIDEIIGLSSSAKRDIVAVRFAFLFVPTILIIAAAIVKFLCYSKKIGSIVPIILHVLTIAELIFFYSGTGVQLGIGMILFMIAIVFAISGNVLSLLLGDSEAAMASNGIASILSASKSASYVPSAQSAACSLKGLSGTYAGATIELSGIPVWIGRDSGKCNIILDGGKVSRQHCCIWVTGGKIMIKDISTNGVYFPNGDRLLSNMDIELKDGDTIFIGNSDNSFQVSM